MLGKPALRLPRIRFCLLCGNNSQFPCPSQIIDERLKKNTNGEASQNQPYTPNQIPSLEQ